MKTLEELGFEMKDEYIIEIEPEVVGVPYVFNYHKKMFLYSDGEYSVDGEFYITQELHNAIEQEMKKRGWWK